MHSFMLRKTDKKWKEGKDKEGVANEKKREGKGERKTESQRDWERYLANKILKNDNKGIVN